MTLLDTGIRVSELSDLLISDYQPKTGRLLIRHGKGDKERAVWLGEAGRKALWKYMLNRKDAPASQHLFVSDTGRRLGRDQVLKMLKGVAGCADVEHANCHRFRHTFAINFLRNGGNVLALQ